MKIQRDINAATAHLYFITIRDSDGDVGRRSYIQTSVFNQIIQGKGRLQHFIQARRLLFTSWPNRIITLLCLYPTTTTGGTMRLES